MINSTAHYKKKNRELHRVVVTGMGALTPLSNNLEESWAQLIQGKSGITKLSRFDCHQLKTQIAAEVKCFNPENYIDKKDLKKMDLFIQYALAASVMALRQSGLDHFSNFNERAGIILGTSMGGMPGVEQQHSKLLLQGHKKVSPFFIPSVLANMAAARIAMRFQIKGPQLTIKSACATGTHSIGEAYRYIQDGTCDVMLTGGTEANISPLTFFGFSALNGLSQRNDQPEKASCPWNRHRDGFVIGEGAGVLVLESLDHAIDRGATILAEIEGYAATSDAFHITSPAAGGESLTRAIELVLQQSQISIDQINCINAHAASTPVGDMREFRSFNTLFSSLKTKPFLSSNKANIGHCLGAAGAIESAFAVLSIWHNKIPPSINFENLESEVSTFTSNQNIALTRNVDKVIKTSVGFGGTNAAILFSRYTL